MSKDIKAPYFSYEEIRKSASRFLHQYNSDRTLPVPIEKIAENNLDINIIPMNNLRYAFGIDAWITKDFKEIWVDNILYDKIDNRFNFTIAHEIGHLILHKEIFSELLFNHVDEWIATMVNDIDPNQYGWIETHANNFAGLVLVPDWSLKEKYELCVERVKSLGYKDTENPIFGEYLCNHLQKIYEVSTEVIHRRLRYDKIIKDT